jgi:hypothetical protein
MQQRRYRTTVTPDALADFLVAQYGGFSHLHAQKLGGGDSVVVQVGRGDHHERERRALTLGIARETVAAAADSAPGITHPADEPEPAQQAPAAPESELVVTLGEQQWLWPGLLTYTAMMGLVAVLVTPWALFALIWPLSYALRELVAPNDLWATVDGYVLGHGGTLAADTTLRHPHLPFME